MSVTMPPERLQPSLLDRLTDDAPQQPVESRQERFFSARRLREAVLRDLRWLLNASRSLPPEDAHAPGMDAGVLDYGLPELAGRCASSLDVERLAREVRECVRRFEPRILPASLDVRVLDRPQDGPAQQLSLRIEGELWAVPAPLRILVNTCFDLESGRVIVADAGGSAR
jgi:type VI secretion system protein ImpF